MLPAPKACSDNEQEGSTELADGSELTGREGAHVGSREEAECACGAQRVRSERSYRPTVPLQLLTGNDQQHGQREAHAIRHDDEGD